MYDAWSVIKTLHDERISQATKPVYVERPTIGKLLKSVGERLTGAKSTIEPNCYDD